MRERVSSKWKNTPIFRRKSESVCGQRASLWNDAERTISGHFLFVFHSFVLMILVLVLLRSATTIRELGQGGSANNCASFSFRLCPWTVHRHSIMPRFCFSSCLTSSFRTRTPSRPRRRFVHSPNHTHSHYSLPNSLLLFIFHIAPLHPLIHSLRFVVWVWVWSRPKPKSKEIPTSIQVECRFKDQLCVPVPTGFAVILFR